MNISIPDGMPNNSEVIAEILNKFKNIAVVGLSSNPRRPSFNVTQYMQSVGYRITPVNPNETEVLGEAVYGRLEDVPKARSIEIVDIFRRPQFVPAIVESAIAVGAKVVWMQQGIEHRAAAEKARAAGLVVVEDACLLIEHRMRHR